MRMETADKLQQYVNGGGIVVLTVDAISAFGQAGGVFGFQLAPMTHANPTRVPAGAVVTVTYPGDMPVGVTEATIMDVHALALAPASAISIATVASPTSSSWSRAAALPCALALQHGKGQVIALLTSGVAATPAVHLPLDEEAAQQKNASLPIPFPALAHAQRLLNRTLARHGLLFSAGTGLTTTVARKGNGSYSVLVSNSGLMQRPFGLVCHVGTITAITELSLDQSEKGSPGYAPTGYDGADFGHSTPTTIAGLDVRAFSVTIVETGVTVAPAPAPAFPTTRGMGLPVAPAYAQGRAGSTGQPIQEAILLRPSFFQHFDTAVVSICASAQARVVYYYVCK